MHLLFGRDEVRELLTGLQQASVTKKIWQRTIWSSFPLVVMLLPIYLRMPDSLVVAPLLIAVTLFIYSCLEWLMVLDKTHYMLRTLNNTLDVRALSTLSEALEWPDSVIQRIARNTVPSLLLQLRASESLLLTRVARDTLYRQLVMKRADRDEYLLVAILHALEQVGDAQAVPAVERLVAETPGNATQERVHLAAMACLPYLHARFGQHAGRDTLLRAVDQEEPMPHLLLRAIEQEDPTPELLLRSSQGPDEEQKSLLRSVQKQGDPQPEQLVRPLP